MKKLFRVIATVCMFVVLFIYVIGACCDVGRFEPAANSIAVAVKTCVETFKGVIDDFLKKFKNQ